VKLRRPRKRYVRTLVLRRYKPTYMTDLREVPWPYNVWYPRR
jgi:hypothetical protein